MVCGSVNRPKEGRNRLKLGLLVPSTDTTAEVDMYRNLPPSITLHAARMFLAGVTVVDEERMLAEEVPRAAREVASLGPNVAVFACTSAGALHGPQGDAEIRETIARVVGCPAVTVFGSVLDALRSLAPRRLLVFTPYPAELNERMEAALTAGGVPVHAIRGLGITSDTEIGRIEPRTVLNELRRNAAEVKPDCVFASCTNLRAWEILGEARKALGVPILSSNFVTYRTVLETLGYSAPDLGQPQWARGQEAF